MPVLVRLGRSLLFVRVVRCVSACSRSPSVMAQRVVETDVGEEGRLVKNQVNFGFGLKTPIGFGYQSTARGQG